MIFQNISLRKNLNLHVNDLKSINVKKAFKKQFSDASKSFYFGKEKSSSRNRVYGQYKDLLYE